VGFIASVSLDYATRFDEVKQTIWLVVESKLLDAIQRGNPQYEVVIAQQSLLFVSI
jgi:hypothetical protein